MNERNKDLIIKLVVISIFIIICIGGLFLSIQDYREKWEKYNPFCEILAKDRNATTHTTLAWDKSCILKFCDSVEINDITMIKGCSSEAWDLKEAS